MKLPIFPNDVETADFKFDNAVCKPATDEAEPPTEAKVAAVTLTKLEIEAERITIEYH